MKQVSREELLDWWLTKYHNTNVKELIEKYPPEVLQSPDWFKMFPVTQEQEAEWMVWAKKYIKEVTKVSKKMLEKNWPFIYLDCSPYVIREE
jgi:hypothetical protein